jgi:hypothetical protein
MTQMVECLLSKYETLVQIPVQKKKKKRKKISLLSSCLEDNIIHLGAVSMWVPWKAELNPDLTGK